MAVLAAAALLDELMGRNRNIAPNSKGSELNWEDPEFCKLYMVKFCPHDLFVNTRADLGQCPKIHDDEVKSLYEKASSHKKQHYEDEFIRFCQSMLNEVERKIGKGKQRLSLIGRAEAVALSPAQTLKNEEQINFLTDKINGLVDEAEQCGIQGNVEQAQGLMKLCDQLKDEREQLKGNNESSHWQQTAELAAAQEKQMEVCDVCGAFLIVGDAQQRIDDHLMGKQHVGYARLKMALEETMNKRQKQRESKDKRRERSSRDRSPRDRSSRMKEDDKRGSDRSKDDKPREERSSRDDKSRDDKPRDDKSRDDKSREEKSRDEKSRDDKSRDDKSRDDKSRDDRPREDKSRDDKSRDDKSRDDKSRDDKSRRDSRSSRGESDAKKPRRSRSPDRRAGRGSGSSSGRRDSRRVDDARGSRSHDPRRDDDKSRSRRDKDRGLNGGGGSGGRSER